MFNVNTKLTQKPLSAERIYKYIRNGIAIGLTKTAKEGQAAVVGAVQGFFTYRNNWLAQSNKFGIKIKPATGENLSAEVRTGAGWLIKQKIGGRISGGQRNRRYFPFTYKGHEYIARPSRELRPAGSKKVLNKKMWPNNLKNPFVLRVKNKNNLLILFQRYGPGKRDIAAMYILDPVIDVKPKDAFYTPIRKVIDRRLVKNIDDGIKLTLGRLEQRS